jgi:hypothetical protein
MTANSLVEMREPWAIPLSRTVPIFLMSNWILLGRIWYHCQGEAKSG